MCYSIIPFLKTTFYLWSKFLVFTCFVPFTAQAQEAGATIYGEVKAGKIEADVEIRIVSTATKKVVMTGKSEKGRYRLSGIPAGKYNISARDGDSFLPEEHKHQELREGDEKPLHFYLKRPARYVVVGGKVSDAKGSPIPLVDVIAILAEFEIERTKTNMAGEYEFSIPVAPQEYTFVVGAPRESTAQLEAEVNTVQPTFSDLNALRIDLMVKEEAGFALTLVATISSVEIADLPLRGATQPLSLTAPGVLPGFGNVNSTGTTLSVNGNRVRSNNFTIDGMDNSDLSIGGPSFFSSSPPINLEQLTWDPDDQAFLTRRPGATSFTRGWGTNDFHGSLSYRAGNDAFNARNPFALPDFDTYRTHSGTATLGGPIWEDRIFFFLAYELNRSAQAPTFSPVLVSRLVDLNQRLTGLGLPSEDLHRFLTTSSSDTPLVRLDFNLSNNHRVSIAYDYQQYLVHKEFSMGLFGTSGAPSSARDVSSQYHTFLLKHNWHINSVTVNEAFYSYRSNKALVTPVEPDRISLFLPGLALIGRATDPIEGDGNRQTSHILSENLYLNRGKHSLRFGGQVEFNETLFRFAAFESGRAVVPGLEALSPSQSQARINQDARVGYIRLESASKVDLFQIGFGGSEVKFDTSALTTYIQDSFKASTNLTLIFGLRYKADFPPSFQQKETDGFQPKLGLAWDPAGDGKTLLRASYSMIRERLPQLPIGFEQLMGGQGLQTDHPQPARRVLSFVGDSATAAFNQFIAGGTVPVGPQLATIYDNKSRSPVIQNVGIVFQRELRWSTSVDLTYKYSRADRLLTSTNVNLPLPTLRNGRPDFSFAANNSAFAQIYEFHTVGNSSYHGGILRINRRYSNNFMLDARYTFSKLIDDVPWLSYYGAVSGLNSVSFEATPENVFDPARERALSDAHATHRLAISAQGSMPELSWSDNNFLLRNVGRLSFSGLFNFNSGRYFNVVTGSDVNRDGNPLTDRPLGVGRNTFLGQRYVQLDCGIRYRYRTESWSFEISGDVFNLLNHINFFAFNTVLGRSDLAGLNPDIISGRRGVSNFDYRQQLADGGFGLATKAYSPRRVEIGLKLIF